MIKNIFFEKRALLAPIFKKYCSDEFQRKYEEYLLKSPDNKVKYIYEIILESLFYYCLNFDEINKHETITHYSNTFYECENEKINALKLYGFDLTKIKDSEGKDIDISQGISNKNYKVTIDNCDYDFNFYDYNINKLLYPFIKVDEIPDNNKKQYIESILDDPKY